MVQSMWATQYGFLRQQVRQSSQQSLGSSVMRVKAPKPQNRDMGHDK